MEELTARKRRERALFKEERVRFERRERERVLRAEGKLSGGGGDNDNNNNNEEDEGVKGEVSEENAGENVTAEERGDGKPKRKRLRLTVPATTTTASQDPPTYTESYLDKEHLQLAPEEALFLLHLGLLTITHSSTTSSPPQPLSLSQFLHLACPSASPSSRFLLHYIVYYHFRRQRLIVKPGLKFGVDYLLYSQPIPVSHAAHCVNVLAVYPPQYPLDKREVGDRDPVDKTEVSLDREVRDQVSWQEINLWQRLMGNVRKRLKLVYVLVPELMEGEGDWRDVDDREGLERVLERYKVREVENRRMVIARERDVKTAK